MQNKGNIYVTFPVEEKYRPAMEKAAAGWALHYVSGKMRGEDLAKADVILGSVSPDEIKKATRLKWVQLSWAGVENVVGAGVEREGLVVTNITGAFGQAISEHMVAGLMMLYKKMHLYRDLQAQGRWQDRGPVKSPVGETVLVVGLGDIGGDFARLMKGLGAYVIGLRRSDAAKPPYVDELYLHNSLDEVLPRADIVALALPSTAQTVGLFSRERIGLMKEGATLLNVGRGSAVDTDALCDALQSGKLYGVCLDVTDPEPLPPGHRLWGMENAVITPHVSGSHHLRQTYERTMEIFEENLGRFARGETLKNVIDFGTGYRRLDTK